MTEPEKKTPFSFGTVDYRGKVCPRGNRHCKVVGEKENHFHCHFCDHSNEIFTSEEELKKHISKAHYTLF